MLTIEERYQAGLEALEQFQETQGQSADLASLFARIEVSDISESTPLAYPVPPISTTLSPGSLLIGYCEDGLPFVLDLKDPDCGSILICGDRGSGKTHFLRAILSSAAQINPSDQVSFFIVAPNPDEYHTLTESKNCSGVLHSRKPEVLGLIDSLLDLADRRQYQKNPGPVYILAIDNLADFIHGLNDDAYWGFEWLVRTRSSPAHLDSCRAVNCMHALDR